MNSTLFGIGTDPFNFAAILELEMESKDFRWNWKQKKKEFMELNKKEFKEIGIDSK